MHHHPLLSLRPFTLGLVLLLAACADDGTTDVDAIQVDGVWVFTYSEAPSVSMDALNGGQATVVDGCLQVGDAVVVWHDHHLDSVEEVLAGISLGETIDLQVGGGGHSLDEGATDDDFPAEVLEHCSPTAVWLSSGDPLTTE